SDLIAANTDVQSLASSVAAVKVQLGRSLTRGLGTGGDPELGFDAAQESADEIRQALAEARLIFICTGLGGGTGSGAAPVIAQIAREMGSRRCHLLSKGNAALPKPGMRSHACTKPPRPWSVSKTIAWLTWSPPKPV